MLMFYHSVYMVLEVYYCSDSAGRHNTTTAVLIHSNHGMPSKTKPTPFSTIIGYTVYFISNGLLLGRYTCSLRDSGDSTGRR